jgi:hypothetical protein
MRGAIPPLPQYVSMAWCLVKHRDNFTFTFYNYPNTNSAENIGLQKFTAINITILRYSFKSVAEKRYSSLH